MSASDRADENDYFAIAVDAGWNLFASPLDSFELDLKQAFDGFRIGPIWELADGFVGNFGFGLGHGIACKTDYWAEFRDAIIIGLSGKRPADTSVPLPQGCSLIGIIDEMDLSANTTVIGQVWQWNSAAAAIEPPPVRLVPGRGYWEQAARKTTLTAR